MPALALSAAPDVVMIQIFTQDGRSQEAKQSLFAAIADRLADVGVAGEDVFLGYVENTASDWSFGFGRAQYVTGELAVPAQVARRFRAPILGCRGAHTS